MLEKIKEIEKMTYDLFDLQDLDSLKDSLSKINASYGGPVSDEQYLQICAANVLMFSRAEAVLKRYGLINRQSDIKKILRNVGLTPVQLQLMLHLFYARHCIVHNGDKADSKFITDISEFCRVVNIKPGDLVTLHPSKVIEGIEVIKKILDSVIVNQNKYHP